MKKTLLFLFLLTESVSFSQCYNYFSAFDETKFFQSYNVLVHKLVSTEIPKLKKLFLVDIDFRFGVEKGGLGNAEFNANCQKDVCKKSKCDGTITFGSYCIKECLNKSFGDQRIIAILAHEFGHAIQAKFRMPELSAKLPELHADYLAGYYIGQRGIIEKTLLEIFATEFYSKGDNDFFSPDHHGTPNERKCAFLEGYKMAIDYKFNTVQAFSAGVDYIAKLYPCKANHIISKYSKQNIENNSFKRVSTGNYFIKTTNETVYIKNIYGQIISKLKPGDVLEMNGLKPGIYMFYPCKKSWLGRIRKLRPIYFQIISGKTSGFSINKTGIFFVSQYTIFYPQ